MFDIISYTGSDSSAARTIDELKFAPDFIWQKRRNGTNWNTIHDTVRGAGQTLYTNSDSLDTNNKIPLPTNCVKIDANKSNRHLNFTIRNGFLRPGIEINCKQLENCDSRPPLSQP